MQLGIPFGSCTELQPYDILRRHFRKLVATLNLDEIAEISNQLIDAFGIWKRM